MHWNSEDSKIKFWMCSSTPQDEVDDHGKTALRYAPWQAFGTFEATIALPLLLSSCKPISNLARSAGHFPKIANKKLGAAYIRIPRLFPWRWRQDLTHWSIHRCFKWNVYGSKLGTLHPKMDQHVRSCAACRALGKRRLPNAVFGARVGAFEAQTLFDLMVRMTGYHLILWFGRWFRAKTLCCAPLCQLGDSGWELKAQLADILEAQGSDLDHGGLRSPMAEDQRGCWVQRVPGSIIVQLLDLEVARDPLPPFLECIRKNPAKDFVEQTIPIRFNINWHFYLASLHSFCCYMLFCDKYRYATSILLYYIVIYNHMYRYKHLAVRARDQA